MAFAASGFKTLVAGGAGQLHHYDGGADAIATIIASGYFNDIYTRLKQGDVIIAISGSLAAVDVLIVSSATGATTVTTVNGT